MDKIRMQRLGVVIVILSIVLLATIFHFPIHFENALTLLPEADFDVKIAFWRVFFEPFLGLILFLNRSLYVLEELPYALMWLLIAYLVYCMIKFFGNSVNRKKFIIYKIVNVPIVLGICFAIFVLILFIPLPNNTIVNNSKNSVLVTTHAHTEYSHDGLISQEKMMQWHKRNGFDAFFITDHANHKKTLELVKNQKKIKKLDAPLVMVGEEFSGSNHMSLLGLSGTFETKGMTDKAVIDSVHKYGGAVIINHWFDGKGKDIEVYQRLGVDGFEIENTATDLYYDREIFETIRNFCEEHKLTMIGGLDFHGYGRACSLYNAFEIENWSNLDVGTKEQTILSILKSGTQENIKILVYKDRPFYTKTNLAFRPFATAVNYFRTLNIWQVVSWIAWLLIFQYLITRIKKVSNIKCSGLFILAGISSIFMIVLAINYFLKGEAVIGYSKVYKEYSLLLGPMGLILLFYSGIVAYFRFFRLKNTL
ncbi:PHP domain-containing protein [Aurantibacter sp.]|uniref:PHP domain-containing protein n=1 Tax=Aurantibacter sp. TaxID=2807103 RepID=UPI003266304B